MGVEAHARGYVARPKTYLLTWDDTTDFPGLEVRMRSVPLGQFLGILGLARLAEGLQGGASIDASAAAELRGFFADLGGALISWNVQEETPAGGVVEVPATVDGLMRQDLALVLAIVAEWSTAVAGVAPPLPSGSVSGGTTPSTEPPAVLGLPVTPLAPPS